MQVVHKVFAVEKHNAFLSLSLDGVLKVWTRDGLLKRTVQVSQAGIQGGIVASEDGDLFFGIQDRLELLEVNKCKAFDNTQCLDFPSELYQNEGQRLKKNTHKLNRNQTDETVVLSIKFKK